MAGHRGRALLALSLVLIPGLAVLLRADVSTRLLLYEALLVGVAWAGLRLRGLAWSDVGLREPESRLDIVLLGASGAVALVAGSLLLRLGLEQLVGWRPDRSAFQALEGNPAALALGIGVAWTVAALGEELLYRGFLLDSLRVMLPDSIRNRNAGWWLALTASSTLFGLAHSFQGAAAVIISGAVGMGYGTVYFLAGRNLWPAIIAHGLYDTVAFALVFEGIRLEELASGILFSL